MARLLAEPGPAFRPLKTVLSSARRRDPVARYTCQVHGTFDGMRSTIDKAGRLVIPKTLRDSLGLVPGEVEVTPDGAGLHIEPLADDRLEDEDGLLVIPAAGITVSDDVIRTLRHADQR